MWSCCWRVGAIVALLFHVVLYPGDLHAQSGLQGPQRPVPLSPVGPMPKLPDPPPPPDEPVLTIELTAVAVGSNGKVDSAVTAGYVPSAGRKSGYGYLSQRPDGTVEDSRTYSARDATRGGLLGMKAGEVMMFGVLRHAGVAHGLKKTVRAPTDDEYVYSDQWTANSEVVRFERTKDGGVLTFDPPMYGDANDDEGFGSLQMISGEDEDMRKFGQFQTLKLSEQDLRNWKQFSRSVSVKLQYDGGMQEYHANVRGGWVEQEEVELSIEPIGDYDGWMPRANLDSPGKAGTDVRIRMTVRRHNNPSAAAKAKVRFAFREVSHEKGVCINWPADGADTTPDLRLRFADPALGAPSEDGTSIETKDLVEAVELVVEAYDFGAWGTLRVTGNDAAGRPVSVKVRGRATPDLDIPIDEDHNHVADAWEPKATRGKAADADDEHQQGNSHDGDGLTLYEEYRGLVVRGRHARANPAKKDFFVLDLINSKNSKDGLALVAEAAKLEVHSLDPGEMDASRVINPNSSSGGGQHGVILDTYDDPAKDPGYSEALTIPGVKESGTPRTVAKIQISQRSTNQAVKVPGEAYSDAAAEIAHELLHACGVRHHGEGDPEEVVWQRLETHVVEYAHGQREQVEALTEDGKRYSFPARDEIKVWLARANGQHSGDVSCLMRYHRGDAVYEAPVSFGRTDLLPVRYKSDGGPIGLTLCHSAMGTGINAYDHKVVTANGIEKDLSRFGDAADGRGNCWSQINVNDVAPR